MWAMVALTSLALGDVSGLTQLGELTDADLRRLSRHLGFAGSRNQGFCPKPSVSDQASDHHAAEHGRNEDERALSK